MTSPDDMTASLDAVERVVRGVNYRATATLSADDVEDALAALPVLRQAVEEGSDYKDKFFRVGESLAIESKNNDKLRATVRALRAEVAELRKRLQAHEPDATL